MANILKGVSGAAKGAQVGSSIGGPVGSVIGGVAGFIGGLFGGKSKPSAAEIAADQYLQELVSIGVPPKEALAATYQRLQQQGILTPEMEETFYQADTELNKIEADPALKEAQTKALETLRRQGEQQGMTLEDRVTMEDARIAADTAAKGKEDAIIQNMQARGMGGAGAEIALRAANQQAAANTNALRSAQIASEARKRALDSVLRGGELAGNIRGQDFTEASTKASAQDAINKFNASNRQDVTSRNVAARNAAAEANLGEKQRIADTNVKYSNIEADNRVQALKDQRDMQLDLAKNKYDARSGKAGAETAREASGATKFTNTIGGIADAAETIGGIYNKYKTKADEDKKLAEANAMKSWKDG